MGEIMKTYLVEAYTSDIKFDRNSIIVALTPKACYDLDNKGIEYSIIEDYYDEIELLKGEDEYFKSQEEWINKLDGFLQNNMPELKKFNLKMGTYYYLRLKSMIDPLIIRCCTLNKFVNKIKPSSITFISHPPEKLSLNCKLFNESYQSYYSQIIPVLCKEKNISLNYVYVTKDEKRARDESKNLKQKMREVLAESKLVNDVHFFLKYGKECFFTNKKDKLNILLLKTGYNGMEIIKTGLKNGHNIYLLSGNQIMKYSLFGSRKYLDINIKEKVVDNSKWEDTANQLENDELIKWVNEKCQLDVSDIILPRLKYFILNVCPEILRYFKFFIEMYKGEKIDFVVTPHQASPVETAAIATANYNKGTKSVCILHGDDAFENNTRKINELYVYNIHISSNIETKEYLKSQCKTSQIQTLCYCSSHRVLPIKKIKCERECEKDINEIKNKIKIIYLPTMFMADHRRIDGAHYPDTWYYKLQKSLIEYLATKKEYTFVWKGLLQSDAIYNPTPNFIKDNNFSNIEVATNRFVEHLPSADRVICDYPSTGFYESVVAGVPTMSLYHKAFKVRETAVEYFGNLLQSYSDISEAIERIEEFLKSSPEVYTATIDTEDKSIVEILEEISSENTEDR